jgi:hypothetical protein
VPQIRPAAASSPINGWPLYTYVADTAPGADTGQALNLNGGLWYVLAPSGLVIHKMPYPEARPRKPCAPSSLGDSRRSWWRGRVLGQI